MYIYTGTIYKYHEFSISIPYLSACAFVLLLRCLYTAHTIWHTCREGHSTAEANMGGARACNSFTSTSNKTTPSLFSSKDTSQSHYIPRKCCICLCLWDKECTKNCIASMPRCCTPSTGANVCAEYCISDSGNKRRDVWWGPLARHLPVAGPQHGLLLPWHRGPSDESPTAVQRQHLQ